MCMLFVNKIVAVFFLSSFIITKSSYSLLIFFLRMQNINRADLALQFWHSILSTFFKTYLVRCSWPESSSLMLRALQIHLDFKS